MSYGTDGKLVSSRHCGAYRLSPYRGTVHRYHRVHVRTLRALYMLLCTLEPQPEPANLDQYLPKTP